MGVVEFTDTVTSKVPAAKFFKAWSGDGLLKAAPNAISNIEILQGTGAAGSIILVTFADGMPAKFMKYTVDVFDEDSLDYADSPTEGGPLNDKVEKVSHGIKFEATAEGGCIAKIFNKIYIKDGVEISEEEVSAGRDEVLGLFKALEAYLLANS